MEQQVWISEYNQSPAVPGGAAGRRLLIYDTTLRDGEQTIGVSLSSREKLEIARLLEDMNVERIEAGMPISSTEDFKAVQLISREIKNSEVWGFCRCTKADIDAAVDAGVKAVICEIPTSPYKMKAYGFTLPKVLQSLAEHLAYAKKKGLKTAFFAVDATRTPLDDLKAAYQKAVGEGKADEVVLVDTLGVATPETMTFLTRQVKEWVDVPVAAHCHNDFGMAVACSLAAAGAGADSIHVTANGLGEKTGNADISEIALAASVLYGYRINLDLGKVRSMSRRVEELTGVRLSPLKPVVGENVFKRETGVVIAQILNYPPAVEGYPPELVGGEREILLSKKSGKSSIQYMLNTLGISLPASEIDQVLQEVKALGIKKGGLVTKEEFQDIVNRVHPTSG